MVKFIIPFIVSLILLTFDSSAQIHNTIEIAGPDSVDLYELQFWNSSRIAGGKSRLVSVATSNYVNGNFPPRGDSIRLLYSGRNSWNNLLNIWQFDKYIDSTDPIRPKVIERTYHGNGKLATTTGSYYKDTGAGVVEYDTSNNNTMGGRSTYYFFDAQRRLTLWYDYYSGFYQYYCSYTYGPYGLTGWRYYTPIHINYQMRQVCTYADTLIYSGGKLSERIRHTTPLANSTPFMSYRWLYMYDATAKTTTCLQLMYHPTGYIRDSSNTIYTYNSSGHITSVVTQSIAFGVVTNVSKLEVTYNYLNQTTSERTSTWDRALGAWQYQSETRFHYVPVFPQNIGENTEPASFLIYPNPSSYHLTIAPADGLETYTADIISSNGTLLRSWTRAATNKMTSDIIDVSELPSGNYFIRLSSNGNSATERFTVVR